MAKLRAISRAISSFSPPTKPVIHREKHTLVIGVPCFPGKWSKTSFSHRSKRHCEIFIALFGTHADTSSEKRKTYVPVHDTVNWHVTGKATDAAATGIMNRKKIYRDGHNGYITQFTPQSEKWCQGSFVKFAHHLYWLQSCFSHL